MSFQVYCLRSDEIHFVPPYFFDSIAVTSSNSAKLSMYLVTRETKLSNTFCTHLL